MGETKKPRPVSIGFFDLFITQKPRPDELLQRHDSIGRDASGRLALVRHRKKVNFINCIRRFVTALLNQSITPFSLTLVQAPKKTNPSPPGSTKAEPPASPKAEEPPTIGVTVNTWTAVEDAALLGLKAQRRSWKEISEMFASRDLEAIKERYRFLYDLAPAEAKIEAKEADGGKKAKDGDEKGNDGAKKGKGKANEESKKGRKTPTATSIGDKEQTDDDLSSEDVRTPFPP